MTPEEWRKVLCTIEPTAKEWIVEGFADALPDLCDRFSINTALRQQHFVAQCAWESDHFHTTQEYANGWAYEGRHDLGNTQPGDGPRFKGRGLIQLTGRANYTVAARVLGGDYMEDPQLVWRFPDAATVASWFWQANGLNPLADHDDVVSVTKRINGGTNGLAGREAILKIAKQVIA